MKRNRMISVAFAATLGMLLAAAVPAPAAASEVAVDIRVSGDGGWCGEDAWIEFSPERGSWVALYASFSDGSLRPVFPPHDYPSHWVDAYDVRAIAVTVPVGLRLESVQAVASPRWFDPNECWLVAQPGPWDDGPTVTLAYSAGWPVSVWSFRLGWHSPSRSLTVVRSWNWGHHDGHAHWAHHAGRGHRPGYWRPVERRWRLSERRWKHTQRFGHDGSTKHVKVATRDRRDGHREDVRLTKPVKIASAGKAGSSGKSPGRDSRVQDRKVQKRTKHETKQETKYEKKSTKKHETKYEKKSKSSSKSSKSGKSSRGSSSESKKKSRG